MQVLQANEGRIDLVVEDLLILCQRLFAHLDSILLRLRNGLFFGSPRLWQFDINDSAVNFEDLVLAALDKIIYLRDFKVRQLFFG